MFPLRERYEREVRLRNAPDVGARVSLPPDSFRPDIEPPGDEYDPAPVTRGDYIPPNPVAQEVDDVPDWLIDGYEAPMDFKHPGEEESRTIWAAPEPSAGSGLGGAVPPAEGEDALLVLWTTIERDAATFQIPRDKYGPPLESLRYRTTMDQFTGRLLEDHVSIVGMTDE